MADREVLIRLRADISQYKRSLSEAAVETQALGRATDRLGGSGGGLAKTEQQSRSTGSEIDKLSGRLRVMTDLALIGGPALTAMGAGSIGGIVALSAELGAAAGALGVTILAVKGLGDGLKALDAYELSRTPENFKKLQESMEKLGPAGEHFVRFLDSIEPNLKTLQAAARDGLLPGAEEGIEGLLQRLPELRKLIRGIATELGGLAAEGGQAIGGEKFDAFFKYLRKDGIPILDDTAKTAGNLAEVVANLFAAFGGVSTDFSGGLLNFSQGLAKASENLSSNTGFQEFLRYIETEGPHALDTLGSLADAFLQIVEATAPLGGPVLTVVGKLADIIASIADSDLGTPIFAGLAALALFNRTLLLTQSIAKATWSGPGVGILKNYAASFGPVITAQDRATMSAEALAKAEAQRDAAFSGTAKGIKSAGLLIGGLALASSDYAQASGLSNTASMAMMGTIAGPWGAAIGAGVGLTMDLANANDNLNSSIDALDTAAATGDLDQFATAIANARDQLEQTQRNTVLGTSFLGDSLGGLENAIAPLSNASKFMGMLTGDTKDAASAIDAAQTRFDAMSEAEQRIADGATATVGPLRFLRAATEANAEAAEKEATALQAAMEAMRDKRAEALRGVNAELNYQAAIDDARKALKENGRTVDATTEKGRANLQTLYALADGWNQQSNAAKNAKGSMAAARSNFIDTAQAMGMAADKAKRLADRLFEIPPKRRTEIDVDTTQADAALRALKARMDGIHSKQVTVSVATQNVRPMGGQAPGSGSADGGTVPRSGQPYADRYHYLLADGEEVISNRHGQADRHRPLLKAINSGRLADGGTAGGIRTPLFTSAAGADIIDGAHGIAQALRMLKAALEKSEKSLDKERQARDDLQAQSDQFAATVGSAYSTADPFAQASTSVWATQSNPLAAFDSALASNTANTSAAQSALGTAAGNGLDGPLYQALASSGNLALVQAFAGLSSAQIDQREQQFAAQSNAQAALGSSAAASAGFTAQLVDANQHLDEIRDEVRDLRRDVKQADQNNIKAQDKNAKDVKHGINGAATDGHRRGR